MKNRFPKPKKLNTLGMAHFVVPLAVVVVIGAIGGYVAHESLSHADALHPKGPKITCTITSVSPSKPVPGKFVTIKFRLHNSGDAAAQNLTLNLTAFSSARGQNIPGIMRLVSLNAGKTSSTLSEGELIPAKVAAKPVTSIHTFANYSYKGVTHIYGGGAGCNKQWNYN